jgi:hypothetical protein
MTSETVHKSRDKLDYIYYNWYIVLLCIQNVRNVVY